MIVCDLVNASSPVSNGGDIYLAQRRKFVEAQGGRIRLLQIVPAEADGEERPAVEELARRVPGVHYAGHLGHSETLARALASADIFATASPNETLCLAAIEGLACGLPVVAVRQGGIQSVVTEAVGALAAPGDAAALAQAIDKVRQRGRAILGEAARQRAVEHFSWEATFRRTLTLYQRLLAARRRAVAAHDAAIPHRLHP